MGRTVSREERSRRGGRGKVLAYPFGRLTTREVKVSRTHTIQLRNPRYDAGPTGEAPHPARWPGAVHPDSRSAEPHGAVPFHQRSTVHAGRLEMVHHHVPSGAASSRVQVRQLSGNTLGSTNDVVEHVAWTG